MLLKIKKEKQDGRPGSCAARQGDSGAFTGWVLAECWRNVACSITCDTWMMIPSLSSHPPLLFPPPQRGPSYGLGEASAALWGKIMRSAIPVTKRLAIFLDWAGSGSPHQTLARTYEVSKAVCNIVHEIVFNLCCFVRMHAKDLCQVW